ncbi:hypothetical protein [Xanthomonas graminis]|uniref:Uncharacterized protein n=1 Tax=Xanthomonas graminis pv. phlei TaxID=487906 RepID=A0A0K3A9H3_9XANT|nr:hypothetical protein [Xanthomonas translucens]UKE66758.1 hypothetical protein KM547_05705 [Xanthomonas translucens pv. phlei]CTP93189.1 hypothetical protein XTPLMG730_3784 [Xanthomonas translucens pv. phlei]
MRTFDVFGIQPEVRENSYVDRGSLDRTLNKLLERQQTHIAIRGASKSGKSWLRQRALENPIVVQCRISYTVADIYRDALARLDIRLEVERTSEKTWGGKISASGEAGLKLLAKVEGSAEGSYGSTTGTTEKAVGKDVGDLEFIAALIRSSGRTLVIEDFHYLPVQEQTNFAFDLKTLWDYRAFVVVVGVWISENMLITLNPDLSDRIEELSVTWSESELKQVFKKGCAALNLRPTDAVASSLASISYESVGLLQKLALRYLDDELGIIESAEEGAEMVVSDESKIEDAAMHVAEQLNQLYQTFARRVSEGIRSRTNATGIYAHAMAVIMVAPDNELSRGISAKAVHKAAHARQSRIQFSNLKAVLTKFPELQVDSEGRGLVVSYDSQGEMVSVVDRQLLLYRRFATVRWPWEELIEEVSGKEFAFE